MHLPLLIFFLTFLSLNSHAEPQCYVIKRGETFNTLASRFNVGINELQKANPDITNQSLIYAGKEIILPTSHLVPEAKSKGVIINLAEPRLYFLEEGEEEFLTFPISVGADQKTPTGKTRVLTKRENPSWRPPQSVRDENPKLPEVVQPGPTNPLGKFAIDLDSSRHKKWQSIAIHGTANPLKIGGEMSHGCIRLRPKDIETLFAEVKIYTPVTIVNQPLKLKISAEEIYLESHFETVPDEPSKDVWLHNFICKRVENCEKKIDWEKVDEVVLESRGIPRNIQKNNTGS